MSERSHLANTGAIGGTIIIGGTVVSGWYLLAVAMAIVAVGALCVRVGFRRKRAYNQA